MENWTDKKVLILGLAKSGRSVAQLLLNLGAQIVVNDARPLTYDPDALALKAEGVSVVGGSHSLELLTPDFDYLIKNPGIPYSNPLVQKAEQLSIPVITEVELASQIIDAPITGVTGSNGKTTTSTLIADMLRHDQRLGHTYLVGNIGTPLADIAEKAKSADDVVVELSSFQLQGTEKFKPHIALITNIYSAHLDYHGSQEAYEVAKLKIAKNQTVNDYLIYNADQDGLFDKVSEKTAAKLIPFSYSGQTHAGSYVRDEFIYFKDEKIASIKDILLPGEHNIENILAAIAAAKLMNCSIEAIQETLKTFHGVAHRIQYIGEFDGRKFYNDSKATNVEATITALKSFKQPIVLIAGGLDRHLSVEELKPYFQKNVRSLVGIGETKKVMTDLAAKSGVEYTDKASTMEEAVKKAYQMSETGDTILLSPAHASWDQYTHFEERGNDFISAFQELKSADI